MKKIIICCIDDQPEVSAAVAKDLTDLHDLAEVVVSNDPEEIPELIDDLLSEGRHIGVLVSDHVMPGTTGVELLISLRDEPQLDHTKTCLLTGLATHEDTIKAINEAKIDQYIAKPWDKQRFIAIIRGLITKYIFDAGIDHLPLMKHLDQEIVLKELRQS